MTIDFNKGIITIDNVSFFNGFTFEDFKKTKFFDNQDGTHFIDLKKDRIDGYDVYTSLFWDNGKLSLISLILDQDNFTESDTKKAHDSFLEKHGVSKKKVYEWGTIEAIIDPKSGFPSIDFSYSI